MELVFVNYYDINPEYTSLIAYCGYLRNLSIPIVSIYTDQCTLRFSETMQYQITSHNTIRLHKLTYRKSAIHSKAGFPLSRVGVSSCAELRELELARTRVNSREICQF